MPAAARLRWDSLRDSGPRRSRRTPFLMPEKGLHAIDSALLAFVVSEWLAGNVAIISAQPGCFIAIVVAESDIHCHSADRRPNPSTPTPLRRGIHQRLADPLAIRRQSQPSRHSRIGFLVLPGVSKVSDTRPSSTGQSSRWRQSEGLSLE